MLYKTLHHFCFQHSMLYFFHHYELPAILHQAQIQQLLARNQGNLHNLLAGQHTNTRQNNNQSGANQDTAHAVDPANESTGNGAAANQNEVLESSADIPGTETATDPSTPSQDTTNIAGRAPPVGIELDASHDNIESDTLPVNLNLVAPPVSASSVAPSIGTGFVTAPVTIGSMTADPKLEDNGAREEAEVLDSDHRSTRFVGHHFKPLLSPESFNSNNTLLKSNSTQTNTGTLSEKAQGLHTERRSKSIDSLGSYVNPATADSRYRSTGIEGAGSLDPHRESVQMVTVHTHPVLHSTSADIRSRFSNERERSLSSNDRVRLCVSVKPWLPAYTVASTGEKVTHAEPQTGVSQASYLHEDTTKLHTADNSCNQSGSQSTCVTNCVASSLVGDETGARSFFAIRGKTSDREPSPAARHQSSEGVCSTDSTAARAENSNLLASAVHPRSQVARDMQLRAESLSTNLDRNTEEASSKIDESRTGHIESSARHRFLHNSSPNNVHL